MSRHLALPARLTIAEAVDVAQQLSAALMGQARVVLDAHALGVVDTAGLQLLTVFIREAQERAIEVQWEGVGPELREASRLLGLSVQLKIDSADRPRAET